MSPVRVCVDEVDVVSLELTLGYSLSLWTQELAKGRSLAWEHFAMTGHAIRNTLSWADPENGQRVVYWSDDAVDTLHAVARTAEAGPVSFAVLSPVVRRYADCAAEPSGCCARLESALPPD